LEDEAAVAASVIDPDTVTTIIPSKVQSMCAVLELCCADENEVIPIVAAVVVTPAAFVRIQL
jgi:hypothetical protein